MTRQNTVVIVLCIVLILFCTFTVPWQGVFRFKRGDYDCQTKIFLGYAPVFLDPSFEYDEQNIEYIGKRMGLPSISPNTLKMISVSYKIDISRLAVEIFILIVFAAMIIVIMSGNKRDDYKKG